VWQSGVVHLKSTERPFQESQNQYPIRGIVAQGLQYNKEGETFLTLKPGPTPEL
jgi:hypothetical protein